MPTPILKVTTDLKQQTVEIEYTGAAPIAVGDSETATIVVETNGTHQPLLKIPAVIVKNIRSIP